MSADSTPVVRLRNIAKRFGSFVAIYSASMDIDPGEIHALVGENGAGKSTLMNILYGLLHRSDGEIEFDGRPVSFANPREAIAAGIGMVHQHFKLAPSFTVSENIILGAEPLLSFDRLDTARADEETRRLSERFGLDLDPRAIISTLPVGLRQRVEILKALYRGRANSHPRRADRRVDAAGDARTVRHDAKARRRRSFHHLHHA